MPNEVKLNQELPIISKSKEYYEIAVDLVPSQTQTLAKGTTQHVKGVAPIFAKSADGCIITDVDDNQYIDYTMAVGPLSLGYKNPVVDEAIKNQLNDGITYSLPHYLEAEVAQIINTVIPNAEGIRYGKSGADVTSAAVRLARAFTGKSTILCCGYHGWHDWYIGVTDRDKGIPESTKDMTYTFNYNDIDSLMAAIDSDTAGIILEPVTFDEPKDNFLQKIREICDERGIVLIFDEMWTGFRMAVGGAQQYFGIDADIAVFSKAVANGMPISLITGKKEIMKLLESEVFFYTTFGGEALSLAAVKATINELIVNKVPEYLEYIGGKLRKRLTNLFNELSIDYINIKGYNFRLMPVFSHSSVDNLLIKSLLQQELLKHGILWSGYFNMSYAHKDEHIDFTIDAFRIALNKVNEYVNSDNPEQFLLGEKMQAVFRKISNFNMKPKV